MNTSNPLRRENREFKQPSRVFGFRHQQDFGVTAGVGPQGIPPPPSIGDAIQAAKTTGFASNQATSPVVNGSWADRVSGVVRTPSVERRHNTGPNMSGSSGSAVSANICFAKSHKGSESESSGSSEFTDSDDDDGGARASHEREMALLYDEISTLRNRAAKERSRQAEIERHTRRVERACAQVKEVADNEEARIAEVSARLTLVRLDLERSKRDRALSAAGSFPRPTEEDNRVCGENEIGVTCCICLDKRRRIPTFRVCLHACVCVPCLQGLLDDQRTTARCPLCCTENDGAPLVIVN